MLEFAASYYETHTEIVSGDLPDVAWIYDPDWWNIYTQSTCSYNTDYNSLSSGITLVAHIESMTNTAPDYKIKLYNEILSNNHRLRTFLNHKYSVNPVDPTALEWQSYLILINRKLNGNQSATGSDTLSATDQSKPDHAKPTTQSSTPETMKQLDDKRTNKLIGQLAMYINSTSDTGTKITALNTFLEQNKQLVPYVDQWLNSDKQFHATADHDWKSIHTHLTSTQADHLLGMKGLASPAKKAPQASSSTTPAPPTPTREALAALAKLNEELANYKYPALATPAWMEIYNCDLTEWCLSDAAFAALNLPGMGDIPLQVYGIIPGTNREAIHQALHKVGILCELEDIQMYTMKTNSTPTATLQASITAKHNNALMDQLCFRALLTIDGAECGIRIDQAITRALEFRIYDKNSRDSIGRYAISLAMKLAGWSEVKANKFATRELRTEGLACIGVRWDGFMWEEAEDGGQKRRKAGMQIDYGHPDAGLLGCAPVASARLTTYRIGNENDHFFPSVRNFKQHQLQFTVKIWLSPDTNSGRNSTRTPGKPADPADITLPDDVEPSLAVIISNFPTNAQSSIASRFPSANTTGARQRALLRNYLADEADRLVLDSNPTSGLTNWDGLHYIVAKSTIMAEDIVKRINLRMATKEENLDNHRIDFFHSGNNFSDLHATLYTDIKGPTSFQTVGTARLSFANPNPPKAQAPASTSTIDIQAMMVQMAALQAQITALTAQNPATPPAAASRDPQP